MAQSTNSLEVIVMGAKGRMGQMILSACAQSAQSPETAVKVIGAVEAPGGGFRGMSVGGDGIDATVVDDVAEVARPGSVIIDFTAPSATLKTLEKAVSSRTGMVIGTTGMQESELAIIREAAKTIPIVMAPNMSLGVNLLCKVVELVASRLGMDFDIEIIEAHHNQKKDAPSGTALALAQAAATGLGVSLDEAANYGREGLTGARPRGEIGIHAVRAGDIVGDHTVLFAGAGERLELKHVAHSRQTFAQGAVKAALFLHGKAPGFYTMVDVLGL